MTEQDWVPAGARVVERHGTAAPATVRPNPLRRERWVDLGELYPGHQVLIRFNPNKKGLEKLPDDASEDAKLLAGLKLMVREHRIHFDDGTPDSAWIDPDTDQAMPHPSTSEFWEALSNEQLAIISMHIAADQKKVQASAEKSSGLSTEASPANVLPSPTGTSDA